MKNMQAAANDAGSESKIRELTLAEAAAVSGASYQYCPAPTIGLYVDEVITPEQRVPVRPAG